MSSPVRRWLPATLVVVVIAAVLTMVLLGRTKSPTTASTQSYAIATGVHSTAAVIAAVQNYYKVEDQARATGNADLIDTVTTGPSSPASFNFKNFVSQQAAKNRRSVITRDYFEGWAVQLSGDDASARYTFWLLGHDIDATTGQPVEIDMLLPKVRYRMDLRLVGTWLVQQRELQP